MYMSSLKTADDPTSIELGPLRFSMGRPKLGCGNQTHVILGTETHLKALYESVKVVWTYAVLGVSYACILYFVLARVRCS